MTIHKRSVSAGQPQRRTRAFGGAACGIAAVLLVAGCGSDGSGSDATGESNTAATPAVASTSASPGAGRLTEDQAERERLVPTAKVDYKKAATTAVAKIPGGKLVSLELKRSKDGKPEWETDVAEGNGTLHQVGVDADGGKVTRSQADADQDTEDRRKLSTRLGAAKVTWDKAATTATDRRKGTVTTVELDDMDNDKPVWKVDVVTPADWDKTTYDIDAVSGKVVREHVDRD